MIAITFQNTCMSGWSLIHALYMLRTYTIILYIIVVTYLQVSNWPLWTWHRFETFHTNVSLLVGFDDAESYEYGDTEALSLEPDKRHEGHSDRGQAIPSAVGSTRSGQRAQRPQAVSSWLLRWHRASSSSACIGLFITFEPWKSTSSFKSIWH